MTDYQAIIDDWVKKHSAKNVLIFVWYGHPNTFLIEYVKNKYAKYICYWFVLYDSSKLELENDFLRQYPHLTELTQLLNPIGTSVFSLYSRSYLWLISNTKYRQFLEDFDYDSRLICYLNVSNWEITYYFPSKPWYRKSSPQQSVQKVTIIGTGIVGAMTAYFLADKGIEVVIVDKETKIASQASGNYQGIMYAKASASNNLQTELLYKAYGLSLTLLKFMDTDQCFSDHCGVLHLDYKEKEKQRNQKLAEKKYSLFRYLNSAESSKIAGIDIDSRALFWPNGAWVHPQLWIKKLLQHPAIKVITDFNVIDLQYQNHRWQVITEDTSIESDVVVLALGADANDIYQKFGLNFYFTSGQTSLLASNEYSQHLKVVLSGHSYIAPAYQNKHCYGATFHPNNKKIAWCLSDDLINLQNLAKLNPQLYQSVINKGITSRIQGHQAVRCDSFDHLPTVGALGDVYQMRKIYAKLRFDKNYRINTECPYWPNLYVNTAHGSRGLLTASLCSLGLVSEILNLPNPLGLKLRQVLSPNRLIINDIVTGKIKEDHHI